MEGLIPNPRGSATLQAPRRLLSAYLSHPQPSEAPTLRRLRGMAVAAQQSQKAQPSNPRLLHRLRGMGILAANEGVDGQTTDTVWMMSAC
jgi:hypothetical protein